jgi:hypothetical protein
LLFENIDIEKEALYRTRMMECSEKASDYSFMNLWGWAEEYGLTWAWEDDLVWIRQERPEPLFWAPVGDWERVQWGTRLTRAGQTFTRVPGKLAEIWEQQLGDRIKVVEERDNWDYIYSVEELVLLKGNRFHKKKNLLNQFLKKNEFSYEPFGPGMFESAAAMQEDWCSWKDCESSDILAAENRAIMKVLGEWDRFENVLGGAIFVDRIIVAYTVGEILTNDTVLIHFEKGCPAYKGVYQAINQMFLADLPDSFTWVNREQDLGEEGLRKAKLSYHPTHFLKKYRVTLL